MNSFKSREDVAFGLFSLTILTEVNQTKQEIKFKVRFDFEHGVVDFNTIRSKASGEEEGWLPPREIRPYITEGCVDVFCLEAIR